MSDEATATAATTGDPERKLPRLEELGYTQQLDRRLHMWLLSWFWSGPAQQAVADASGARPSPDEEIDPAAEVLMS